MKHILASIELEDQSLIQSLTSSQPAYVYVHESRMAMINTLARSRQGARALLDTGLILKLSNAKFISSRPNIQVSADDEGDKARQHRYRLLIFPVLRLINTLQVGLMFYLTLSGGENRTKLENLFCRLRFFMDNLSGLNFIWENYIPLCYFSGNFFLFQK